MDTKMKNEKIHRIVHRAGIALGLLFILLGGLLLSANFGLIPNLNRIIISWQMLLIVIGIVSLFRRHLISGLCLILVGGFFIIPKIAKVFPDMFPCVNEHFVSAYWAILLIGAGIIIILYWIVSPRRNWHIERETTITFNSGESRCRSKEKKQYEINGDFSKLHIFSSGEYIVLEPEFKGGNVQAIFGSVVIDLHKTTLPEGDTYLDLTAVFGGVVLHIPDDWRVESKVECIFSGISDKRRITDQMNPFRRLVLVGSFVFSGCEIK